MFMFSRVQPPDMQTLNLNNLIGRMLQFMSMHLADKDVVVIQQFETADDMAAAESAFDAMDPSETPGTRASVDRCELKAEMS